MSKTDSHTSRLPRLVDLVPSGVETARQFAGEWAAAATGVPGDSHAVRVVSWKQPWASLSVDRAITGGALVIANQTFAHGLGTHPDSEIVLRAGQPIRVFRAWVGMDGFGTCRYHNEQVCRCAERLIFSVEVAGRELWRSSTIGINTSAVRAEVPVGGATELVLRVCTQDGNTDWAHADWADAEVELADGTVVRLDTFVAQPVPTALPPFSFRLGGKPSAELLGTWQVTRTTKPGAEGVKVQIVTWRDPQSGLECEMEQQTFAGFPAVEWVLRFRNTGKTDTPIIEDIQALDVPWAVSGDTQLRRSRGSPASVADFEFMIAPLPTGETIRMAAGGGRSSNAWLPFFNLQNGKTGVITAIGWSGQWAAEFARPAADTVRLRAGQELTHLVLHPGEEIRAPRMLMLFWEGDAQESHNLLRRFLLAHHVPKDATGRPVTGPVCAATWGGMESVHHLEQIADIRKHKLDYDYYWIDAGWYGPAGSFSPDVYTGEWAKYVGHWNINPRAHPNGLKPLADAAHAAGLKFLLWFEPERALTDTPWTIEHPEWYLGERKPGVNLLFNLGNPAARRFLTDFISNMIREVGIDCYRQDFNIDPLSYWRGADAPDRQGMAEIRYVEGHYEFWDELLRRHPGLLIDNCASGGRRIDLETVSRSIPLWRSDYQCFPGFDPAGCQVQTHGLSYWLPVHGCGTCGGTHDPRRGDTYNVRSNLSASLEFPIYFNQGDGVPDHPWDWQRRMIEEYKRARPFFYGDYYPLTAGTPASDVWLVMQYHRPDLGEGLLLAFRRKDAPFFGADFRLQALDPAAEYELQDADTGKTWKQTGKDLRERGVRVEMEQAPESRLVFYRKQ
jgi:alpha-galactosidase